LGSPGLPHCSAKQKRSEKISSACKASTPRIYLVYQDFLPESGLYSFYPFLISLLLSNKSIILNLLFCFIFLTKSQISDKLSERGCEIDTKAIQRKPKGVSEGTPRELTSMNQFVTFGYSFFIKVQNVSF